MKYLSDFKKKSYCIIDADNFTELNKLKKNIYDYSIKKLSIDPKKYSQKKFYDYFHELNISDIYLNKFRLDIIKFINMELDSKNIIFNSFEKKLTKFLGQDIAIQKKINLVIQMPNNSDISPTHRDAPENSPFEIVFWVPLVDCEKTKSIYLFDKETTDKNIHLLDTRKTNDLKMLDNKFKKNGKLKKIKFGQGLIFWSALLHSVPINKEKTTRWSFNIRFKNLFTPYGPKGFPEYFEKFKISDLSHLGFEFNKKN